MSVRKRVVLLTRPGSARERTEAGIIAAGAEVAAVLDPGAASEGDVRNAAPDVGVNSQEEKKKCKNK